MDLEKVSIKRIIGPTPSGAAVLLGNEKKTFVVFIGFYEAAALIREMNKEVPARPLTHELIQNVFMGFDVEVKQLVISSIIENTFCPRAAPRNCVLRVIPLRAALANGLPFVEDAVHRANAAEILPALEQNRVHLARCAILELLGAEHVNHFLPLSAREPTRM